MSRTKRPAKPRASKRSPRVAFRSGLDDERVPASATRIADIEEQRHPGERGATTGEFWEFRCDIRSVITRLFASFEGGFLEEGSANLFITDKLTTSREAIEAELKGALQSSAQQKHTQAASFLFEMRVGDIVTWAVEFAFRWARIQALTNYSGGYTAVSGDGFHATAKIIDLSGLKAKWREELRDSTKDLLKPLVRSLRSKPGRESKRERDLEAQRFRNDRVAKLEPSVGKQRAMEIAKSETMKAFDLKTPKLYRNAMERKSGVASPTRRLKKT